MIPEELKSLEKKVKKSKRIASEWAAQLHDLVEDRLPAAHDEIPELAQSTFDACVAWRRASDELRAALVKQNSTLNEAEV